MDGTTMLALYFHIKDENRFHILKTIIITLERMIKRGINGRFENHVIQNLNL